VCRRDGRILGIGDRGLREQEHVVGEVHHGRAGVAEIPEGGGSLLEDPIEEAKRELLEETGLVAGEWTEILNMYLSNSVTDEHAIIYLARNLEQRKPSPEETENSYPRKIHWRRRTQGNHTSSKTPTPSWGWPTPVDLSRRHLPY
jgi:8-oxo-dGTP pyrophosphatase MutT (NUDIX family)